jgi:hypothetical protein
MQVLVYIENDDHVGRQAALALVPEGGTARLRNPRYVRHPRDCEPADMIIARPHSLLQYHCEQQRIPFVPVEVSPVAPLQTPVTPDKEPVPTPPPVPLPETTAPPPASSALPPGVPPFHLETSGAGWWRVLDGNNTPMHDDKALRREAAEALLWALEAQTAGQESSHE